MWDIIPSCVSDLRFQNTQVYHCIFLMFLCKFHDTWFHVYSISCFGLEFLLSTSSKSFELPKVWSSCVVLHLDSICLVFFFFFFWSCLAQGNVSGKCHVVVFFEVCTFWFVFEFATIWNCSEGCFLLCFLSWRSSLGNFDVFGFHFHLKLLWKLNPNKV